MQLRQTRLPGVGVRHELTTGHGVTIGVVSHRNGELELIRYDADDPDEASTWAVLSIDEADAIAEILSARRDSERAADRFGDIPGLTTGKVTVAASFDGRTLGDTQVRTRTGASIVALARPDEVVASPTPAEPLRAGDVLVVIGTREAIEATRDLVGG